MPCARILHSDIQRRKMSEMIRKSNRTAPDAKSVKRSAKVLFLEPPLSYDHRDIHPRHPPLYAAYAAALLEDNGFETAIIDAFLHGYTQAETISHVVAEKPDVVILLLYDYTRETPIEIVLALAEGLEEALPDSLLGLAGSMDSVFLQSSLEQSQSLDFAIVGEYELPVIELALALRTGAPIHTVASLHVRQDGDLIRTGPPRCIENLDTLHFPAWHLTDFDKYVFIPHRYRHAPFYPLLAGRGCPFSCSTCSEASQANNFRIRSVENVIEEIHFAIEKYGAREIQFSDATFGLKRDWVFELCDKLDAAGIKIPWSALSRVDVMDSEMLQRMARSGCWNLLYGIESGNQHTLERIKKGFTLDQAVETVRATKEAGIETTGSFILGLPGESRPDVLETIAFSIRLDLDYAQFFLLKHIGQQSDLEQWGRITKEWDYSPYDIHGPVFIAENFGSLVEIKALQKLAYRRFYFRWSFIKRKLQDLAKPGQVKRLWAGGRIALRVAFSSA